MEVISGLWFVFGWLNYNYVGKYYLSGMVCRDGLLRFLKENWFGIFLFVFVVWIFFEEDFLKNSEMVNNLKFRGSYGELGF